jgi:long-chain acyl-CoA synthetase
MSDVLSWDQSIAALTGPGGPFEIVEREVGGHKMKVFANVPATLRERFQVARLHGDKTFLVYEDETWSFSDTMRRVY